MKNHLKNIISEAEAALAKLEEPAPQPPLKIVPVREGVVRAEWDPALAELNGFDIHYYNVAGHREWQLNIRMHVPDADLSQGYWDIPLNFEGLWKFEARAEGYSSGVVKFDYRKGEELPDDEEPEEPEEPEIEDPEEPEPPVKKRLVWFGFWDHYINDSRTLPKQLHQYVNVGKAMSRQINVINNHGLPAIMHLGNLHRETQSERMKRVRGIPAYVKSGDVPIIHFIDEPLAKGVKAEDLDELVEYARSLYGNKYKYAYTINGGELYYPGLRDVSDYAQKFDYVFHQTYPYRNEGGSSYLRNIGDTKAELFASLDLRLKTMKEKIPNSKFFIVPQGFYSPDPSEKVKGKYRLPPSDSPEWYTEWCMANEDVEGLIFWKYFTTNKKWIALDGLPDHIESLKRAFHLIPDK